MNQNTLYYAYSQYLTANRQTHISKTSFRDFVSLTISQCFQRLIKTYHLFLYCYKACQSALIKNIRSFTFSFITASLHNGLNKNGYQHNTVCTYLIVDHWVQLNWKMLTCDNLANPGLSQGNPSSKWFSLPNL